MSENLIKESTVAISKATKILSKGGLVSIKAETVYGLACDPSNPEAILKLYNLKNRPSDNPLIIHVNSLDMLKDIAEIDALTSRIINFFWPGPLTLILPRKKNKKVLDFAVAGLSTIAVRMPASEIFLKLINKFGKPVAAPSANQSGYISSTKASHVIESFGEDIELVIDSGQSEYGLESTIIDLSSEKILIRRLGVIDKELLEKKLKIKIYEQNELQKNKPNSPGQSFKHYSPNTPIKLNVKNPGEDDAFLGFGFIKLNHKPFLNLSENGDLNEAAFNLFNFLRKLDKLKKKKISIYPIPKKGIGKVINERLNRAKVNE
jgi:L-threonylcarbamoyladenylate synthase